MVAIIQSPHWLLDFSKLENNTSVSIIEIIPIAEASRERLFFIKMCCHVKNCFSVGSNMVTGSQVYG